MINNITVHDTPVVHSALSLDMTKIWTPSVERYLGRVSKARVLEAVGEGASVAEAERMAGWKKGDMAEAAETLLDGKGGLPPLLRTVKPASDGKIEPDGADDPDGDGEAAVSPAHDANAHANADADAVADGTAETSADIEAEPDRFSAVDLDAYPFAAK